jgi:hypothetical protein
MALSIQYDFFKNDSESDLVRREIDAINDQVNNVRKGLFARHRTLETSLNNLLKLYLDQQEEIAKLKMQMIKIKN